MTTPSPINNHVSTTPSKNNNNRLAPSSSGVETFNKLMSNKVGIADYKTDGEKSTFEGRIKRLNVDKQYTVHTGKAFISSLEKASIGKPITKKTQEFYEGLNQSQRTKILIGIRKDVMVEMKKVKSQMNSIETLDKNYLKLLSSFKELQALHIKYSPASVLSQGLSITRTLAGKIPNAFGAGVGVINRLSNLSEFKVEGFIYDDPLSDHYHAGFNAFDHDGNGFIFLRIDGLN